MPREAHGNLKKQARKKFGTVKSDQAKRYIYGTLQKIMVLAGEKHTSKGRKIK